MGFTCYQALESPGAAPGPSTFPLIRFWLGLKIEHFLGGTGLGMQVENHGPNSNPVSQDLTGILGRPKKHAGLSDSPVQQSTAFLGHTGLELYFLPPLSHH